MPSFYGYRDLFSFPVYRLLFCQDGRSGLESGPEDQVAAVAYSPQNAAGMIGPFADGSVLFPIKSVIIVASESFRRPESVADLETLHSSDGTDPFGETGAQLVKAGFSHACGQSADHAFHHAAAGILPFSALVQISFRKGGGFGIRHVDCIFLHLRQVKTVRMDGYGTDGPGIGVYGDAKLLQKLCRHCAGRHPSDGLSAGGTSAACIVAEAVFAVVGVVCVSGAVIRSDLPVIPGALRSIADHQGDGSAGGHSLEDAREDLHGVVLLSRCREPGLPRFSAIQIDLDILLCKGEPGRAAVDDDADASAMGFSPGGDG